MGPREDVEVDACAAIFAVPARPDVRYRRAVEETGDGECDAVGETRCEEEVGQASEALAGEDAEAEAEE